MRSAGLPLQSSSSQDTPQEERERSLLHNAKIMLHHMLRGHTPTAEEYDIYGGELLGLDAVVKVLTQTVSKREAADRPAKKDHHYTGRSKYSDQEKDQYVEDFFSDVAWLKHARQTLDADGPESSVAAADRAQAQKLVDDYLKQADALKENLARAEDDSERANLLRAFRDKRARIQRAWEIKFKLENSDSKLLSGLPTLPGRLKRFAPMGKGFVQSTLQSESFAYSVFFSVLSACGVGLLSPFFVITTLVNAPTTFAKAIMGVVYAVKAKNWRRGVASAVGAIPVIGGLIAFVLKMWVKKYENEHGNEVARKDTDVSVAAELPPQEPSDAQPILEEVSPKKGKANKPGKPSSQKRAPHKGFGRGQGQGQPPTENTAPTGYVDFDDILNGGSHGPSGRP